MHKRFSLLVAFGLLVSTLGFSAGQTEEKDYQGVNGLKNWNQKIDLTTRDEGKYNLIIRGTDEAGNVAFAGPFNVFLDPESDLPVTGITNPQLDQRVGGLLNIVGTAVDDDGVALVEVKINEDEWQKASGTIFWSLNFDGRNYPDGYHSITVRATDINGIVGREVSTSFHLDKFKPDTEVVSHSQGQLVSGVLNLQGTIEDANGIATFEHSSDDGKTWQALRFTLDRQTNTVRFNLRIDTKRLPDGPKVWWFRSTDKTKSVGYAVFLFFVDNTLPVVEFFKPLSGQKVQGLTHIAGRVYDPVGIKTLSYLYNKIETPIEIIPGNPFFSIFVDLPTVGTNAELIFTVSDNTGNTLKYPLRLGIDPLADLPQVDLRHPQANSVVNILEQPGLSLVGTMRDDDGVSALWYSLDGASPTKVSVGPGFAIPLENVPPGIRTLTWYGEDSLGVKGRPQTIKFTAVAEKSGISPSTLVAEGGPQPGSRTFVPGLRINRDAKNTLSGFLYSRNQIQTATIRYGTDLEVPLTLGRPTEENAIGFSTLVPSTIPYGIVEFSIEIKDIFGQTSSYGSFLYVINYTSVFDEHGIYLHDSRLTETKTIRISTEEPLTYYFVGDEIAQASILPAQDKIQVVVQGPRISLIPLKDGVVNQAVLQVKTKVGHVFTAPPLTLYTDNTLPTISLLSPSKDFWTKGRVDLQGEVKDEGGIASLDYSFDNGKTWVPIPVVSGKFSVGIENTQADGPLNLMVRAVDTSGNTAMSRLTGVKDSTGPELSLLINNEQLVPRRFGFFAIASKDLGPIDSLQYRYTTQGPWTNFETRVGNTAASLIDFGQIEVTGLLVRGIDRAGNETIQRLMPGLPGAQLQAQPQEINYPTSREFSIDYTTEDLVGAESGESLSLKGRDGAGEITWLGPWVTLPQALDRPLLGYLYPATKSKLSGVVVFGGFAMVAPSIDPKIRPSPITVQVSINGQDPRAAELQGELWKFSFDTKGLPQGENTITFKAINALGMESTLISKTFMVDNDSLQPIQDMGPLVAGPLTLTLAPENLPSDAVWTFGLDQRTARPYVPGQQLNIPGNPGTYLYWLLGRSPTLGTLVLPLGFEVPPLPTVNIQYPLAAQVLNGTTLVRGLVSSSLPITAVEIKTLEGQAIPIKVNPGMGTYSGNLDLTGSSSGTIVATVSDALGRRGSAQVKVQVTPRLDEPLLEVPNWDPKVPNDPNSIVEVRARDDDGIKEILYSFNGAEDQVYPSTGSMELTLPSTPGKHTLVLTPVDLNGLKGPSLQVPFSIKDGPPRIKVISASDQTGLLEFVTGLNLGEIKPSISGTITTANGLTRAEIKLNDSPYQPMTTKLEGSIWSFSYILPTLFYGKNIITMRAIDSLGIESTEVYLFYKVDKSYSGTINDATAIYLKDDRIADDNHVYLKPGDVLSAYFKGRPIESVQLVPPVASVEVNFVGTTITMEALTMGISQPTRLQVKTIDGDLEALPPLIFHIDDFIPALTIPSPVPGQWVSSKMDVRFEIQENLGIESVEYFIDTPTESKKLTLKTGALPPAPVVVSPLERWNTRPLPPPPPAPVTPPVSTPATTVAPATTPASTPAPTPSTTPPRATTPTTTTPTTTTTPARPANPAPTTPTTTAPTTTRPTTPATPAPTTTTPPRTRSISLPGPGGQSPSLVGTGSATGTGTSDGTPLQTWHVAETIDLGAVAEGGHLLIIKVTDTGKNSKIVMIPFQKDITAPELNFVTPRMDEKVNGIFTVTATAADIGSITDLAWSADGITFTAIETLEDISHVLDLSVYTTVPESFLYRIIDKAGNQRDVSAPISFDPIADKPVIQIHTPRENEVLRQDFVISGLAFDDDGMGTIWYRIDNGEWVELPPANNFSIPQLLKDTTDNGHVVEVKAVDIYGTASDVQKQNYRISKEEPSAHLVKPDISITNRGIISLEGTASDANGIKEVWISLDNGNTWTRASGTENWSYVFDSRIFKDGTYAVQVKVFDNYDTEGLFTTIVNIDNTAPQVFLDKPNDGDGVNGSFLIDGRAQDNIDLVGLEYVLYRLDALGKPVVELQRNPISSRSVFLEEILITDYEPGWYNIRIEARDKANNYGYAAKNVLVLAEAAADRIDFLYPLTGDVVSGMINVEGRVTSRNIIEKVTLLLNGEVLEDVPVNSRGYFSVLLGPGKLQTGEITLIAQGINGSEGLLKSGPRRFSYTQEGPWVLFSERVSGDFIRDRPFIVGKAGWHRWPASEEERESPTYRRDEAERVRATSIERIELSFDNGRTFTEAQGSTDWKFRLETLDMADGPVYLIVRAVFTGGETAIAKQILTLDQTPPELRVLGPAEGGAFNESVAINGTATDNYALDTVQVNLRKGDKTAYEVPGFIEGLYLDGHFLGSTSWEVGAGLTFFDDKVRLQALLGNAPEGRFEGWAVGAKLLATIADLPYSSLFGPDLAALSSSLSVGAKFTYFSMNPEKIQFNGDGIMLGAVVVHLDALRFTYDWPVFSSITGYAEYEVWMISSDVQAGFLQKLGFGLSVDVL